MPPGSERPEVESAETGTDISWMKGDPNPLTRALYRKHRDLMEAGGLPGVTRLADALRGDHQRIE